MSTNPRDYHGLEQIWSQGLGIHESRRMTSIEPVSAPRQLGGASDRSYHCGGEEHACLYDRMFQRHESSSLIEMETGRDCYSVMTRMMMMMMMMMTSHNNDILMSIEGQTWSMVLMSILTVIPCWGVVSRDDHRASLVWLKIVLPLLACKLAPFRHESRGQLPMVSIVTTCNLFDIDKTFNCCCTYSGAKSSSRYKFRAGC